MATAPETIVPLLRLSPLIPFNALNYILAGTSVSTRVYVISLAAMLPATVGYVYIGAVIADTASQGRTGGAGGGGGHSGLQTALLVVGAVAAAAACATVSYFARRELQKRLDASSEPLG